MEVTVHVDGGARGNPGPAAIGVVVSQAGEVLDEYSATIGVATNNVAEYRAVLAGVDRARLCKATAVEMVNDSELVARQIKGEYKVRNDALKDLRRQALAALQGLERWSIRNVPRAENAAADALVNAALDEKRAG